jgi:hypothetical protein
LRVVVFFAREFDEQIANQTEHAVAELDVVLVEDTLNAVDSTNSCGHFSAGSKFIRPVN